VTRQASVKYGISDFMIPLLWDSQRGETRGNEGSRDEKGSTTDREPAQRRTVTGKKASRRKAFRRQRESARLDVKWATLT
jgi:hypothetical protein